MNSDLHSGFSGNKPASHLLGWTKARFREVMTTAEALHDFHWAAPWDASQSPQSAEHQPVRQILL